MRKVEDLVDIQSEAGVIATIIQKPDMLFFSENLRPEHFSDLQNKALYKAIKILFDEGVQQIDSFNLLNCIKRNKKLKDVLAEFEDEDALKELIDTSVSIARKHKEDYEILVKNIINSAYRRDLYKRFGELQGDCLDERIAFEDLTRSVDHCLDKASSEYVIFEEPKTMGEQIDDILDKIVAKRRDGSSGYPSIIPELEEYYTYERAELFLLSAQAKKGKSMFLMNESIALAVKHNLKVVYIDSELTDENFATRMLSYLSKLPVRYIKTGNEKYLTPEQLKRATDSLLRAKAIIKKIHFIHIYKPDFDKNWILSYCKKLKKEDKIDVFVFDYFKGAGTKGEDASSVYLGLGKMADFIKNIIVGELDLIGLAACQSNRQNDVADSENLKRSCSTLAMLEQKTLEDQDKDGHDCGNMRIRVTHNRNGGFMDYQEWVDIRFVGDECRFEKCTQHTPDYSTAI